MPRKCCFMPHVDGFPDRDGMDKLIKLAKALCTTVNTFSALIQRKYPDSPLIPLLLTAIAGVCALIPDLENEFLEYGGFNDTPLNEPESIAGIDPSALPALPPEYV